jgi:hypothetical protein
MLKNLFRRENLKWKEVKKMKRIMLVMMVSLILVGGLFTQASAVSLVAGDDNVMFFNNFENIYDANGNYVAPDPARGVLVGDHFFGIINIQNIDVGGITNWFSGPQDQLTGFFAQRVTAIYGPFADPYDALNTQFHLALGAPTITSFTGPDGTTANIAPYVSSPAEMLWLFNQSGAGTTPFESNGTVLDDFNKVKDGSSWLTAGMPLGTEYWYSHASIGAPLVNFTGETWAGIDVIVNNTGYLFGGINDPNENELGGILLLTDIHLSGEIEGNPARIANPASSPWDFRSNDPAHINPIPEPGTILLLGSGLLGLGAFYGRRRKEK